MTLNLLPATNPCADEHVKVVIPLENVEESTEIEGPVLMTICPCLIGGSPAVCEIPILFAVGTFAIL
tara:strand:- start:277 stop:477 length:201 start_codon:yes stop_codon:yes gene_type:complete